MNSDKSDQRKSDEIPWTAYHLYQFLHNPLYTGDTVYNRFRDRKYDSSHYGKMSMDEWKYVPDTHPAYRSKERYQNENTATVYQTGIYARLSNKNFMSTDVDVLGNQLNHLRDYVANHDDMVLVDTYIDDGWCGSSFNRPDFNRMMADVKSGRINCVVVRDFSRFGRNYLEMGYYLNEVFPSYNLRFISIFDDFDSLVSDADSMLFSMMQIVNDFYSKDISRKICAVCRLLGTECETGYQWQQGIRPSRYHSHGGDCKSYTARATPG